MSQVQASLPTVQASFSVEPHPDPVVRALITEVERLRAANLELQRQVQDFGERLGFHGSHPR
jgi:hypothetical protein